ncbi:MAG: hypothetical protein WCF65_04640 [Parachlamydiaceae bacterium]
MNTQPFFGNVPPSMGPIPPCATSYAPPVNCAVDSQKIALINQLGNFTMNCNAVLSDLQSASSMEMCDAWTSNYSFMGSIVTNMSYNQNMAVAGKVDALRRDAEMINGALMRSGIFSSMPMGSTLLSTDFSGSEIKRAENAEHNFFMNLFTSNAYSSMASTNTMQQINWTIHRVSNVRDQASRIQNMLGFANAGYGLNGHTLTAGSCWF